MYVVTLGRHLYYVLNVLLKVIRLLNVPSLGLKLVLRKGLTVDFFVMWYRAAPDPHNKVGP